MNAWVIKWRQHKRQFSAIFVLFILFLLNNVSLGIINSSFLASYQQYGDNVSSLAYPLLGNTTTQMESVDRTVPRLHTNILDSSRISPLKGAKLVIPQLLGKHNPSSLTYPNRMKFPLQKIQALQEGSGTGGEFVFSQLLGGTNDDWGYKIAVDSNGSFIIIGTTESSDFPTLNAFNSTFSGGVPDPVDVFITKYYSNGSLQWSTFFGGNHNENAEFGDVVVDNADNIIITGYTYSSNFPRLNAYDSSQNGQKDAFLAKFHSNGSLIFSTFLGGDGDDEGTSLVVCEDDNIILSGTTRSSNFPVENGNDTTYNGQNEVFISKFSKNGSELLWSTFLGGTKEDFGYAIALDSQDNIVVTGKTEANGFPILNAYDPTFNGGGLRGNHDVFISKLSSNGSVLLWSTYLGGSHGGEEGRSIVVDSQDNVLVTGITISNDFPTLNAFDSSYNPNNNRDSFITKLSANGSTLLWSTYLGGNSFDDVDDMVIDSQDNVIVTGYTDSEDFPILNAYDTTRAGYNAFITKVTDNGSLLWSTFLGDNDAFGYGVSINSQNNIIITGNTHGTYFIAIS